MDKITNVATVAALVLFSSSYVISSKAEAKTLHQFETNKQTVGSTQPASDRLSELTYSDNTLRGYIESPDFERLARESVTGNPNIQDIERRYPGIIEYIVQAVMEFSERRMYIKAARVRSQLSAYYSENLTINMIAEIISFLGTPTGTKFLQSMDRVFNVTAILGIESGGSSEALIQELQNQFSREETAEIETFGSSPAGEAWLNSFQQLSLITGQIMTLQPTPEEQQAMEEEMRDAITRFIDRAR